MKFLLNLLDKPEHFFHKGGKLERLMPLWDAQRTFLFTPPDVTKKGPHIRDAMDLKRLMITVVVAMLPVLIFSFYNTGYQTARAYGEHTKLLWWQLMLNGVMIQMPIILVSYAVGGIWEGVFAVIRKHKISEGFLVTGLILPLTLPPSIPLWQVAVGVTFGVIIGKEIFGGTGMNVLNPALTARVFLFFSYPAAISGDTVWIKLIDGSGITDSFLYHTSSVIVDGMTGATALAIAAKTGIADPITNLVGSANTYTSFDFDTLFFGLMPGSIGETSALMSLVGAAILIITGVGSWRIIIAAMIGVLCIGGLMNFFSGGTGFMAIPPHYHLVMGGFMFGAVFMATDPVSASATNGGKWIYGFMIGALCVTIRVVNPAYPEGMMLAILFMNVFSPLIDHYVIKKNINRRLKRAKK